MKRERRMNAEQKRLEAQRTGAENWRLWGPYLSERAWGTVREDYSAHGDAWEHFSHDHARSRAYRWNEDGLGGLSDEQQRLCFALALWNGRDPILKERAFGLTGNEGNHGEDVKEYYFYVDATPSHSWLRYLYKYSQSAYPYERLAAENRRRGRGDPPFNLLDTGVFDEDRYWDVEVLCAKASPKKIHVRIEACNRGPEPGTLHLLPSLWFRNTWSWGESTEKPALRGIPAPTSAAWAIRADHPTLGNYHLYGRQPGELLFSENETNTERLWGVPNAAPYVKDAFHRRVIAGDVAAVDPDRSGTKFAAWHACEIAPGQSARLDLVLSAEPLSAPFARHEVVFSQRRSEADEFFDAADAETVATIKELIETRVRPAVANDGGDITFKGFKDGVVYLNMKGACSGCPSSTATLRHGIQNLLRHFLPDVTEVRPM